VFNSDVRLQRSLPVLAASVVLLSGCGVANTQFHPGVAAQVGDDTITTKHVDQVTDDYCTAVEVVTKGDPSVTSQEPKPRRYLTRQFANSLILTSAVQQLARDYKVVPTSAYRSRLAQLEPQLEKLDDEQHDAVVEILSVQYFVPDVLTSIGGVVLAKEGNSSATDDDKLTAGQDVLTKWIADHDVEVNPTYGIEFGSSDPVDSDLSYAAGTTAKNGLADKVVADYAEGLPESQYCLLPPVPAA
jgi:peptidyl-prolyl cis-trans isomerase SurA